MTGSLRLIMEDGSICGSLQDEDMRLAILKKAR